MKCQMFWKCMELVAADSPTRAVSWVRAWWFILSPIDTCTCARALSPAKYASSSFALIFLSLLFSHESFLIFRGLGHSLVLLLRLRSFPPTTYNVTRLGKTEFLVPFSCLHQTALSNCPDKTVVEKVSKGNKWSGQVRILSEHYWEVKSLLQLP